MADEELGAKTDDDVGAKKEEAAEHHEEATEQAAEQPRGQPDVMRGEGNQPPELGYAPPDTGLGEEAESEIPTGVDQLDPDKVAAAKEAAESGGGDGDDGEAFDVSAVLAKSDKANATAETDTGGDEGETVSEGDET